MFEENVLILSRTPLNPIAISNGRQIFVEMKYMITILTSKSMVNKQVYFQFVNIFQPIVSHSYLESKLMVIFLRLGFQYLYFILHIL